MKDIYLDSDYVCHLMDDGSRRLIQTEALDSIDDWHIPYYRYIPEGESWTRWDGEVFTGPMLAPARKIDDKDVAQQVLDTIKSTLNIYDDTLLLAQIRHNYVVTKVVEEVFNVYAKVNDDNYITAIDSDAFIEDLSLWIKIDEGQGDLYKFAKNNYCKYGITASDGSYNYKLVRGRVVYMPQTPVSPTPTVEERLNDLETAICDIMDILAEM